MCCARIGAMQWMRAVELGASANGSLRHEIATWSATRTLCSGGQERAEFFMSRGRPDARSLLFPILERAGRSVVRTGARGSGSPCWNGLMYRISVRTICAAYLRHAPSSTQLLINEVADHLGHADPGFTARVYAHTFAACPFLLAELIDRAIASARASWGARADRQGGRQGRAGRGGQGRVATRCNA